MKTPFVVALLIAALLSPLVHAQYGYGGGAAASTPTPSDGSGVAPQQSTGAFGGVSGTAIVVIVVLAALVMAGVVVLARRRTKP